MPKLPSDLGILKRVRTPIDPAFADRAAGGYRTLPAAPEAENYFGPGKPMQPLGPVQAVARAFDYAVSINQNVQPRAGEPVSFEMMRALADNHDLTRLCIETRKDQMTKLKWGVRGKENSGITSAEQRLQAIEAFLRYPDRQHSWQAWLRILLEDQFVIDAATIYPRQALNGQLYALEIVDGATIKLVLDGNGRTPVPPQAAYQQIIKGMPATNYTAEELIYQPRNPRSWKVFGYSPVEQTIMIVNIALRRQLFQLHFYTEGNVPEGFAEVPADWAPDQIAQFQAWWDAILSGNLAERRRMRFIPAGTKPVFPKLEGLKDEFDEWMARIVCYCHSLPPTPFVKQVNRATAQSAQQAALEEGLQPQMAWVKDLMDYIIWRYWGFDDLEFAWLEEESPAPDVQATIDASDMAAGIARRSEIRAKRGYDEDDVPDFLITNQGLVLYDEIGQEPEPAAAPAAPLPANPEAAPAPEKVAPAATEKLEKAIKAILQTNPAWLEEILKAKKKMKKIEPIDRQRPALTKARSALHRLFQKALQADRKSAAAQLARGLKLAKAADEGQIDKLLAALELRGIAATRKEAAAILARAAQNGGLAAFAQIDFEDRAITSQVNKLAVEWAENRAAELVTKVEESTREMLRTDVTQAVQEGWSTRQLRDALEQNYGFSEARADTIARTEIAKADCEGNLLAYQGSGVVRGKEAILGSEHDADDECDENVAAGVIPLDEAFPSGDMTPPFHPKCVCDFLPVLGEKEGD